jgi:hypothetical protein
VVLNPVTARISSGLVRDGPSALLPSLCVCVLPCVPACVASLRSVGSVCSLRSPLSRRGAVPLCWRGTPRRQNTQRNAARGEKNGESAGGGQDIGQWTVRVGARQWRCAASSSRLADWRTGWRRQVQRGAREQGMAATGANNGTTCAFVFHMRMRLLLAGLPRSLSYADLLRSNCRWADLRPHLSLSHRSLLLPLVWRSSSPSLASSPCSAVQASSAPAVLPRWSRAVRSPRLPRSVKQ